MRLSRWALGLLVAASACDKHDARVDASTDASVAPPEGVEKLLLAVAACNVTDEGVDQQCEARKELRKARDAERSTEGASTTLTALGKKHLKDENAAVRAEAAGLMRWPSAPSDDTIKTVLDAIGQEKHPAVIVALTYVVNERCTRNKDVGAKLLALADHDSAVVRKTAYSHLSSIWCEGLDGRETKLIDKMEKDADPAARAWACREAGHTADERTVPVYESLTKDEKDSLLYSSCMEGLMETWLSDKRPSEKAYRLFLTRLAEKPRTDHRPPWTVMHRLGGLGGDTDPLRKWRAAAPWFKKGELVDALASVVPDEAGAAMARTNAVQALVDLQADKAVFAKLDKACTGKCNSKVEAAVKDAATKAR